MSVIENVADVGPTTGLRGSRESARWEAAYRQAVRISDIVLLTISLRVGLMFTDGRLFVGPGATGGLAAIVGLTLLCCLWWFRAWDRRILGQGAEEFRRMGTAVFAAIVIMGLTALAADIGNLRPYVFIVLPVTGGILIVGRYAMRRALHSQRGKDRCMHAVIAAGSIGEVADLIRRTRSERHNGWCITAVCVPETGTDLPVDVEGVPVAGLLEDLASLVSTGRYRVVAVTPDAYWTRRRLQQLSWDIEGSAADLVVSPGLMEVTGPRLHVAPVYGLTMLRVSQPTFTGGRYVFKAVVDRILAASALVLVAPLMLLIATAIKVGDRGPVFYRQYRVGRTGDVFPMLKFRSMVSDADRHRDALADDNDGAGPMFKMRRDPRVTRIGALLRRYSLDELPQLVNVLRGEMAVVGPRPPLPEEVARYALDARRRLLVKPGLTGLWQVNGRSDLSWEESIRLDLRYVENWSLALDAVIIWKTVGAVVRGRGAY